MIQHTSEVSATESVRPDFKGRSLELYHPNSRGTGSAARLELRLNRNEKERYNCFFIELAAQKSAAQSDTKRASHATFDWGGKITVKLGFLDVCELLSVLEERVPCVGGPRKGLYHANGTASTLIGFRRDDERGGYYLSLSRKRADDKAPRRIGIGIGPVEGVGLRCLLQTGLFYITFPSVLTDGGRPRSPSAA